jgi:hypothetical protein
MERGVLRMRLLRGKERGKPTTAGSVSLGGQSAVSQGIPTDWESLGRMAGVDSLEKKIIQHELEKSFAQDRALVKALLFPVHAIQVEKADTSSCEHLIEAIVETDRVRPAQGHVAFMFPDYTDAEEVCMVPEVRRFVRALHERLPHLLYFLSPEPVLGQFMEFGAAFSPDDSLVHIGNQIALQYSDQLLDVLFDRLVAVWRFAKQVGDDAERVVTGITKKTASGIPAELVRDLIAGVGRTADGQG